MAEKSLPFVNSDALPSPVEYDEDGERILQLQSRRRRLHAVIAFLAMLCLFWTVPKASHHVRSFCSGHHRKPVQEISRDGIAEIQPETKTLVALEAHIMSKCPDARDCLKMLVLPTMQRVHDKVNFTLSYIGTPTDNDGVSCMHGAEECTGNIIELCASHIYPDPKIYLGFTMCLSRDYQDIPDRSLVEDCALEHAIDFEKLNECMIQEDGGFGVGMLRDSVRRSSEAGVTKSCTVRLDEKIYCIRDDGEWKDCPNGSGVNDLVIAVEKLYRSS